MFNLQLLFSYLIVGGAALFISAALFLGHESWLLAGVVGGLIGLLWVVDFYRKFNDLTADIVSRLKRVVEGDYEQAPVVNPGGGLAEATRYIYQITSILKEKAARVEATEARLEGILNAIPNGILFMTNRGVVELANPPMAELLELNLEEIEGKHNLELLRSYIFTDKVCKVGATGVPESMELKVFSPSERLLHVNLFPLDRAGVLAVIEDVTKMRHLEQLRSEFVANVSHELRTPLTSIKGFAETLRDGALEDREAAGKFVHIIIEEASRLTRMIENLLELSDLEARKKHAASPVKIPLVVDEVLLRLGPRLEGAGLEVVSAVPDHLPEVRADKDLLHQVLFNLVENAINYTPAGGRVEIGALRESNEIGVWVRDTGIGIPEKDLPRIFERFYRVDRARSRRMGGTGLGLSIVKHIIENYGGRVEVESEVGKGSKFTFWLPVSGQNAISGGLGN